MRQLPADHALVNQVLCLVAAAVAVAAAGTAAAAADNWVMSDLITMLV